MRSAVPEHTWTQVLAAVKPGIDQTRRGLAIRAWSAGMKFQKIPKTLDFCPAGPRAHRGQRIHAWPMRPCGRPSQNTHGHRCFAAVKPEIDQMRRSLAIRAGSAGPEITKITKTLDFSPEGARAHRGQRKHTWPMRPCGRPFQSTHGQRCLHLSNLESTNCAAVWRSARGRSA
jgi:hypothetical protein